MEAAELGTQGEPGAGGRQQRVSGRQVPGEQEEWDGQSGEGMELGEVSNNLPPEGRQGPTHLAFS